MVQAGEAGEKYTGRWWEQVLGKKWQAQNHSSILRESGASPVSENLVIREKPRTRQRGQDRQITMSTKVGSLGNK